MQGLTKSSMQLTICSFVLLIFCLSSPAEAASSSQINYILHCQGCHLPDGAATEGKVPALRNEVGKFLHVAGGREFLIRVPGTSQSALTDPEVADVLNWILKNFSPAELPRDFTPYSSQEISRLRRPPLANVGAVRSALMEEILTLETGSFNE